MGVCVLDIVKNFNFASCYGIGKGTWAIDQVGATHQSAYSWSHHDSNYNSQPKVVFFRWFLGMAILYWRYYKFESGFRKGYYNFY